MATAPAPAAAPQTRAEPVSAPHDVPHLTASEPDTRSSVVRPPEHARADDAAVPTGAGGRPRAPPISRRRRVSYASPPRARAMLRRGSPPCDACAASPRRGRPIVLLNHATLRPPCAARAPFPAILLADDRARAMLHTHPAPRPPAPALRREKGHLPSCSRGANWACQHND